MYSRIYCILYRNTSPCKHELLLDIHQCHYLVVWKPTVWGDNLWPIPIPFCNKSMSQRKHSENQRKTHWYWIEEAQSCHAKKSPNQLEIEYRGHDRSMMHTIHWHRRRPYNIVNHCLWGQFHDMMTIIDAKPFIRSCEQLDSNSLYHSFRSLDFNIFVPLCLPLQYLLFQSPKTP